MAGTRAQSCDRYGSGTLHPGQVLGGSLPLLPPIRGYILTFYERCCANSVSNLLTPWSTVLLEKLTGFQLVKKFPAFYGTRRFITAVTSARHLSLS